MPNYRIGSLTKLLTAFTVSLSIDFSPASCTHTTQTPDPSSQQIAVGQEQPWAHADTFSDFDSFSTFGTSRILSLPVVSKFTSADFRGSNKVWKSGGSFSLSPAYHRIEYALYDGRTTKYGSPHSVLDSESSKIVGDSRRGFTCPSTID